MEEKLREYAHLIVSVGLNLQKGQTLILSSPVECAPFARLCVSAAYDLGAGEVVLNSIDTDGVRNGFDLEMLDAVAARVNIPIIASGGAGKKEDFLELFHHKGIDAGLAAGIFHQKLLGIRELKEYLNASGVEMRL